MKAQKNTQTCDRQEERERQRNDVHTWYLSIMYACMIHAKGLHYFFANIVLLRYIKWLIFCLAMFLGKIQLGSDRTKLHLAKIWCIIIQSDENLKFNCLSISNSPSKFSKLTVRFIELKNNKKHIWQKFVATCSFIRLVWEYVCEFPCLF